MTFGQALRQLGLDWYSDPSQVSNALEENFSSVIGKRSTARYSNPNSAAAYYMLLWQQNSAQGYTPEEIEKIDNCPIGQLSKLYF